MHTLTMGFLEDGILEVRLNRPDRLNAINTTMVGELTALMRDLNNNRSVRVVILTGEGKGFCSGADLMQGQEETTIPGIEGMGKVGLHYKHQEYLADMILAIHECDKPIIAAINGVAVGGGFAMILACDIRIASEKAKFGSVFIKTGLSSCDVGTSYFLPKYVGASTATELMLTGRIFEADEAARMQLVSQVVAPRQLGETALTMARAIAANNEYGVWMTKKGLRSNLCAPSLRHAMEIENRTQILGCMTGCMEEAMQAFAEHRPPRWSGL